MARNKVILIDADVISHFIATGNASSLDKILAPHALYILENVYKEATRHPSDRDRKSKVDDWISNSRVRRIAFPENNMNVKKEFFRLKKENARLGEGERACMAVARYGQETIASSNFRDVADYCEENHIDYIGTFDILTIAMNKGVWTQEECNKFISDAIDVNDARFPVSKIEDYTPKVDLSSF